MTFDPRSIVQGLDELCPTCSQPTGAHTLRRWSACMTEAGFVDPLHEPTDDEVRNFTLDWDGGKIPIADHVSFVAAVAGFGSPLVGPSPLVVLDFASSAVGAPTKPGRVARLAFIGSVSQLRASGSVLRDTFNAAANKAEKLGRLR